MIARADALRALEADRFDLAVVGGGITGAGVALDAASRGYSVALVERADFASGTSSRSSKLVHGGLRYLQNFDLGLVREALLERALMVKLAPHLVKPLPLLVPFFEGRRDRATSVGLNLYDVMASERLRVPGRRGRERRSDHDWSPDRHRTISGEEALELVPALERRPPSSAYLFYDCQTDDSRLVLTVLGEAERFGAVLANRLEVTGLIDEAGRAVGVRCADRVDGAELEVHADNVVNATGVWADRLRPDELYEQAEVPRIRPSRGTHLTLSAETLPVEAGAIMPAGGGRTAFVLPWLGRTLVGTTDRDYEGDIEHVAPDDEDIEYLLSACNSFFEAELDESDITGAYAGVRPLISTGDPKKSVDISRKAELYETGSGLVTITGGKLTTWRRMAKLAVDRVVEREGREAPCRTDVIPLGQPVDEGDLPQVAGVEPASRALLAARYGHAANDVLALCEAQPTLARTITTGSPDLLAEAAFAARREQALTVGDVLLRRTRLGLLDARRICGPDGDAPRAVAGALAGELGWDEARVEQEVEAWREEAQAEGDRRAVTEPGDATLRLRGESVALAAGRPLLMGILNASPESFYDGARARNLDERLNYAYQLVADGAQIVDVGGQSGVTHRPPVPVAEELRRVVPLVEQLAADGVLVSVDTWSAEVARRALGAGAAMINDPSGLAEPQLAASCAEAGAALVLTHTRAAPKVKAFPRYENVVADVREFLRERLAAARAAGVGEDQLVLDPGPDLAKTPAQTVLVLRGLAELAELGRPLLLAVSRKDFVGAVTGQPPQRRLAGTLAAVAYGVERGAAIVRTHDPGAVAEFLAVRETLAGSRELPADLVLEERLRRLDGSS